jgi:hypothetical protein
MAETESADREPRTGQAYRCFLLRCRLEEGAGPGGRPAWRFTIQQVGPAEAHRSFACLPDVMAYLDASLASSAGNAAERADLPHPVHRVQIQNPKEGARK